MMSITFLIFQSIYIFTILYFYAFVGVYLKSSEVKYLTLQNLNEVLKVFTNQEKEEDDKKVEEEQEKEEEEDDDEYNGSSR